MYVMLKCGFYPKTELLKQLYNVTDLKRSVLERSACQEWAEWIEGKLKKIRKRSSGSKTYFLGEERKVVYEEMGRVAKQLDMKGA